MKKKTPKHSRQTLAQKPLSLGILAWLVVVVALFYHPTDANSLNLQVSRLVLGLAGGLLLLLFWLNNNKSGKKPLALTINPAGWALFALFVWGCLSIIWSGYPELFWYKWLLWLLVFIFVLLGCVAKNTPDQRHQFATVLVSGTALLAIIGIGQALFDWQWLHQTVSPSATLGNKNMTMQLMVLLLPMGFYLFLRAEKISQISWIGLALVLILSYTFYTQTRGAWLAIFVEFLLLLTWVIFTKDKFLSLTKHGLVLLLSSLLLLVLVSLSADGWINAWQLLLDKLDSIYQKAISVSGSTATARYIIWQGAIDIWQTSPLLGTGLGSFFPMLNNEGFASFKTIGVQRVHNDFLELLVEVGLVGILIFLGFITSLLVLLIRLLRALNGEAYLFISMLMIALIGSSINALFSFPYQMVLPMVVIGLYLGLLFNQHKTQTKPKASFSFRISQKTLLLPLVLLGLVLASFVSWYQLSHTLGRTISLAENNQPVLFKPRLYTPLHLSKFNSMADATSSNGDYKASIVLIKQALLYFPKDWSVCFKIVPSLLALKQTSNAIEQIKTCQPLLPPESFVGDIMRLYIYKASNNKQKVTEIYLQLAQKPAKLLAFEPVTYLTLLSTAIYLKQDKAVLEFYQKYTKHHPVTLDLSLKMVRYYLSQNRKNLAKPYAIKALTFSTISDQNRQALNKLVQ